MKTSFVPILGFAFLLISCLRADKSGDVDGVLSVNSDRFEMELPVGEKRLVMREWITTVDGSNNYHYSIGVFETTKDTVFNGNDGKIVSSIGFELYPDSTRTFTERNLLVKEGDQVNLYTFGTESNGLLFGLFKRSAYDTTVFWDRTTVLEYPLFLNKKWSIRDSTDRHVPLVKEFIKLDTLTFDGKKMQCQVFDLHSFVDVRSWISRKGMLKVEIDYGETTELDMMGDSIGTSSSRERFELLMLNPSDQDIEAAKAKYRALVTPSSLP